MKKTNQRRLSLLLVLVIAFSLVFQSFSFATAEGDDIAGYVTLSVEKFTLGQGYLIEPVKVPFKEGDNGAKILVDTLNEKLGKGKYTNGGTIDKDFYVISIEDEDESDVKIPEYIKNVAGEIDYKRDKNLGSGNYTESSGWMYSVNGEALDVGMSDYYPKNGDVYRLQYSVHGYGSDLGPGISWGDPYYDVANKEDLTELIAEVNSSDNKEELLADEDILKSYKKAYEITTNLTASKEDTEEITESLSLLLDEFKYDNIEIFTDLKGFTWAKASINKMADKEIIKGKTDTSFAPKDAITRAEFSALITRLLDLEANDEKDFPFKDVKSDKWYYENVKAIYDNNFVKGVSNDKFAPESTITREEITTIIGNILKSEEIEMKDKEVLSKFKDEKEISEWAVEGTILSVENQIIEGFEGKFNPKSNANRAEVAVIIDRLDNLLN